MPAIIYRPSVSTIINIIYTHLFEIGTSGEDFVDEIFHRQDVKFTERLLNHTVVGERNALLIDLAVTSLVDQLADGLQVGFSLR